MLQQKTDVIDLKSLLYCGHLSTDKSQKGVTNVYRKNRFFSSNGFCTNTRISQMCKMLSRQLQSKKFFMLGSVSTPVICSTDLQRKPSRHRSMSASSTKQTVPYGDSEQSVPQYFIKCQRKTRLANIRRFCLGTDSYSQRLIYTRLICSRTGSNRLRSRLNNYRFMSFPIFL